MPVGVGALLVFWEGWGSRTSPSATVPEGRWVAHIISRRGAEGTQ